MNTGNLIELRPLEGRDLADLARWRNDPQIAGNFFGWQLFTPEGQDRWFAHYQQDTDQWLWIIAAAGLPVGCVGLSDVDWLHRRAELGRTLVEPSHQGRGYATAAVRQLVCQAFEAMGLRRLYLYVFADNEAAITLYRLAGFRPEGLLRQHVWKAGCWRDVLVMGQLQGEAG